MNKEQMLEMKKAYETQLITALAQALNFKEEEITAKWALEQTTISINHSNDSVQHSYEFVVTNDDIHLTMVGAKIHQVKGVNVAIEVIPMSINLQTLGAIYSMITNILNSDPLAAPETDEADEAVVEE